MSEKLRSILNIVAEQYGHKAKNLHITFDGDMFEVLDCDDELVVGFETIEDFESKHKVILL